ncbi:ABC transporter ATP-binding protein [Alicyclobacillus macrosporangiidus]|uniref:ABC-2 type transport system ATP-binding protein n=1 Tax=Alicyclobacillus macrosporangiidus TaxID=392015 RepID=A0A1I7JJ45_9BACL|nr:ATP-binding cassette domain-containing protein [Alicyclobacillus macrosporangiidus]SFU85224.1 ABC-2 type transport system ATP-binding protein [Alicyclobacillus macrosporangiidus]
MTLELRNVSKSFGDKTVVRDLSFVVPTGQVFSLLGLNGAGKTTTIRMILDILRPDSGEILWQGRPLQAHRLGTLGYLPEERGLYPQMKVLPQLVLFGRLQGLSSEQARQAALQWLERFGIPQHRDALVGQLSKGNQQKIQFIAAILHNPDLVILDEPFSGLDPVNTELFKSVFRELVEAGKTIIFSSHRLDHVEALSDAVGIIHRSELVLSGRVQEILDAQPPHTVRIGADPDAVRRLLPPGADVRVERGWVSVPVRHCAPDELLRNLVQHGVRVTHYEWIRPSLQDIFLEKVGERP